MLNRIVFLSVLTAIGSISATLCAPALPFIADHFSAQFSTVQFTISLFLLGNAFGQFLSGPLSDQIGQRIILLGGLFLYILASLGCALANQVEVLLFARFLQGAGAAVGPVLSRAIAATSFPPEKAAQVQSYGTMGIGVAGILSVLCSGALTRISWRGCFWLAAVLGILLFIWASALLKKGVAAQSFSLRQTFSQMGRIATNRRFFGSASSNCITYGLMYGYIALFPFLIAEMFHEKNPIQVATYTAYMIAFYMFGAYLASRLILKWGQDRMIFMGIGLQLISGLLLYFTPLFFLAVTVFNISIGIIIPLTFSSALAPFVNEGAGTASSALGLSYRFLGSILSSLVCFIGGGFLGLSIFFLSVLSLILFQSGIKSLQRSVLT